MSKRSVYIGFDPREADAFAVARASITKSISRPLPLRGLVLDNLRRRKLYWRPTSIKDGRLFDEISDHPMATEFAISRFLTPILAQEGWSLFMDADMLVRTNLHELFELADPRFAVMCVKHDHRPAEGVKMDGQVQTQYGRKNWSSVMLFNCDHPANRRLTIDLINQVPGRDLHRFCWLDDDLIGGLDQSWNWLVGHSDPSIEPDIVHFTDGVPSMAGYENSAYADEWRETLNWWAL
jgi:lipopolysaccharide biosynthesis glycosyltransferase